MVIQIASHIEDKGNSWVPLAGSQQAFLQSDIFETLYEGTRGNGKTETLLMDFAQHVGKGYGKAWRGILFRRTYKQLGDIRVKMEKIFPHMFPGSRFLASLSDFKYVWPGGEELLLRQFNKESDYDNYHGHEYPWIGWEELALWETDSGYKRMMSCCRCSIPGIPLKYRATTNPYGVGHNWVKKRWRLPEYSMRPITDSYDLENMLEPERISIHGALSENVILLKANPNYVSFLRSSARNPAELRAWIWGDWNITSGGMFDDIWNPQVHIIEGFPLTDIPKTWRVDRSFDWGSSKPFSVGWWAQSDGEAIKHDNKLFGQVPGDVFRISEWYGCTRVENQGVHMMAKDIAIGIKEREDDLGIRKRVTAGPADPAIFAEQNGMCVAKDMRAKGIRWTPADNSRRPGWLQCRNYLMGALPNDRGEPREDPGMFVFRECDQFLRTFPSLPRDDKDLDDVDTNVEDHIGDEVRYRLTRKTRSYTQGTF